MGLQAKFTEELLVQPLSDATTLVTLPLQRRNSRLSAASASLQP